ncbi:UNVERIFIED_CONTAM: hypothetical protein GTU68_040519, partial [Idotea baltica]|nr:hypothetical protein [Idotea baltica]
VLLLDNYDSFTYNLYDYIQQLGYDCEVVRNDQFTVDEICEKDFDALVISPGPGVPKDAGVCMELIQRLYNNKPILGICLGYQALGEFFGAKLVKGIRPMHGKTSRIKIDLNSPLFLNFENEIEVMRYHSLVLKDIQVPLVVSAWTAEEEIMAIQHESLPIAGVQFHPESILTSTGLKMMENWFASLAI